MFDMVGMQLDAFAFVYKFLTIIKKRKNKNWKLKNNNF